MPLTGPQSQQLRDVILNAFNQNDLAEMMLFDMNVHLAQHIPEGPLATVAFNLINWCDAQGRVEELLTAVAARRSRNIAVQKAVASLRASFGYVAPAAGAAVVPPPPVAPPTATAGTENVGPLLARVRQLFLSLYPDLDELVLLFEDTLGTRFESVAGDGKPTTQVHEMVKWANANRGFRLCPLLAAVTAQHGNSAELADLHRQLCSR